MSKVEDRAAKKALETFPILFGERMGYDKTNLQQERRNAYEKGYYQAEKDLELSWEDVEYIIETYNRVEYSREFVGESYNSVCKEVLKRFKDFKERKENNYD